jgi:hypothetical protein
LKLIKIIREFVFKSDDWQYKYKMEDQVKKSYYNLRQTNTMSCQVYFEKVRNIIEIKSLGGSLCDEMHLREELPPRANTYTDDEIKQAKERIHDKTVAYGLLVRADRERYGKLIEEIENDFLKGHDDYPRTPTEAYNLLVNYRNHVTVNKRTVNQGGLDKVAFVTEGKKFKGEGGKTHDKPLDKDFLKFPDIKCFKCGKYGHYKSDCPRKKFKIGGNEDKEEHQTETALMTLHVALAVMKVEINLMWILCDNESTVDVFKNRQMVTNICTWLRSLNLSRMTIQKKTRLW